MKKKIATGIWLIFFGIIALLDNINVIDFNFFALLKYWPLLLISLGLDLIFQYKNYGYRIIIIINTLLCAFLLYVGLTAKTKNVFNWRNNISIETDFQDDQDTTAAIHIPFENQGKQKLEFNSSASSITINHETKNLLEASSNNPKLGFQLKNNDKGIELSSKVRNNKKNKNNVLLALNKNTLWDLNFQLGAASLNADLEHIRFSNLEINSGATSLRLKLPMPSQEVTIIEINTAASSSKLALPKDAACAIELSTVLSSNKLEGFSKVDNLWQTDNYSTSDKKYLIKLVGAANSLKINRY